MKNKPEWLIKAEEEQAKFKESKFGKMNQKEFEYYERQSSAGAIGGIVNMEKNAEQLKTDAAKWRSENPEKVSELASLRGLITRAKHPNLASENGKKVGKMHVESGHLAKVRDTNKMLSGANKVIKCPHCPKEGQLANMKRWHYDNCKKKQN